MICAGITATLFITCFEEESDEFDDDRPKEVAVGFGGAIIFRLFIGVVRVGAAFAEGAGALFTGRMGEGATGLGDFLMIGFGGSYLVLATIAWRCGAGCGLLPIRACCSRQNGMCRSAEY